MGENESKQLINRFLELSARAQDRGYWTETEFLTPADQDILFQLHCPVSPLFTGGYVGAERRIAAFGSEELCGMPYSSSIVCLRMEPAAQKFADVLTHRDFLGALIHLGIRREVLGDIAIADNVGYLFCLESIAPYILENLTKVKHTSIRCALTDPPALLSQPPEPRAFVVSSERLDALIAAVYNRSRNQGKTLIQEGKVFVDSRLHQNPSAVLKPGAMVSVRGLGRFCYEGIQRETKKNRLRVIVRVYS